MTLHIDLETYSSVDLANSGVYKYAESPDFEILLCGYAFDDAPVELVDLACGEEMPGELLTALTDPNVIKKAHNANFERTCLAAWLGKPMPPEQWRDTMINAVYLGLPRQLGKLGEALNLPEDQAKMKEGKALITYFCKPCKPTKSNSGRTRNLPEHAPDKWDAFRRYNIRDVETERVIDRILSRHPVPLSEWKVWRMDQRINDRGIGIDIQMASQAIRINEENRDALLAEMQNLTGLENPNSVAQLKEWLLSETGEEIKSLSKLTVQDLLKELPENTVKRVLEIRQQLGKSSVTKYQAMLRAANDDRRVRGAMQHYGAGRTGRWAGRIIQPQNLPQNHLDRIEFPRELVKTSNLGGLSLYYSDPADTLSQLIRTALVPTPGYTFAVSDFSAIEARVVAWLADETWVSDVFRDGGDIYCATASQMFHVPVVKHGVNGELRQKGKIATLALGYGGGPGAMVNMGALRQGLTEEELPDIVKRWRASCPHIVDLWWRVGNAAITAVRDKETTEIGHGVRIGREYGFLVIDLPSGRRLHYCRPTITRSKFDSEVISYCSQTQKGWERVESYGPKFVENIVQAIARDCLAASMMAVERTHPDIVMHVHDEMIVEVPKEGAEKSLEDIQRIMGRELAWAPGLLLRGDGYLCEFYRKD